MQITILSRPWANYAQFNLVIVVLKGRVVLSIRRIVSGQRSGDGSYWRPCLPGTRQYVYKLTCGIYIFFTVRCLAALGDRNVNLYATEAGAPYYKKHFGFKEGAKPFYLDVATFVANPGIY